MASSAAARVAAQPAGERDGGILRGEIVQHVGGEGKARAVAVQDRLVGEILEQHGLAQAVGADQHHVGRLGEEGEREQLLDGAAVALGGPAPVEVGDGLEGAQAGVIEAALERAAGAFGLFDVEHAGEPRLGEQRLGLAREAVEAESAQPRCARSQG